MNSVGWASDFLALRGAGGGLFPLEAATALRLVEVFLLPTPGARARGLIQIAQADASWGAWLVDQVSLGYRRPGAEGVSAEPVDWPSVTHRLNQRVQTDMLPDVARSATAIALGRREHQRWLAAQAGIRERAEAVVRELAIWESDDEQHAAWWWAIYLGAWIWDPQASVLLAGPSERTPGWYEPPQLPPSKVELTNKWDQLWQRTYDRDPQPLTNAEAVAEPENVVDSVIVSLFPQLLARLQHLSDLESRFDETLEHEKLLAMKELAYGASHEINNPLANISSRAQMLLRGEQDPQRRRSLATINSQAFRAHEMIADMMLFAKPPALQKTRFTWSTFIDELIGPLADELPADVDLRREVEDSAEQVSGDAVQLTAAIRAIWKNSLEAMGDVGCLTVTARTIAAAGELVSGWAELELSDTGPGIPPEVRHHLFDPFYSGREAGRGLGFGLSKAWRIVDLHGGQLVVASQPGRATSVTLRIPRRSRHESLPDAATSSRSDCR